MDAAEILTSQWTLLWLFCPFILVYLSFITSLDNLVFILCLLRLQILFKTIGLFDLRVYFIFHITYCVGWECGRLEYLYNSCCCNIFSSSFHMKKFMPFMWLKSNCNEKRWVSGRAWQDSFFQVLLFLLMYHCFIILIGKNRPRPFDTSTDFLCAFPLCFIFTDKLF